MEMRILAKGLQVNGLGGVAYSKVYIINYYKGCSNIVGVNRYFYKHINGIMAGYLDIAELAAANAIYINAELLAFQVRQLYVIDFNRVLVMVINLERLRG
jgi:hypothetical protein